jgi:hypothetical protein
MVRPGDAPRSGRKEGNPWPVVDLTRGNRPLPRGDPSPRALPPRSTRERAQGTERRARTTHLGALFAPGGGGASDVQRRHVGDGALKPARPGPIARPRRRARMGGARRLAQAPTERPPAQAAFTSAFGSRRQAARPPNARPPGTPRPALGAGQPRPAGPRVSSPAGLEGDPWARSSPHRRPRRLRRVLRQEPPERGRRSATHSRPRREPRTHDPSGLPASAATGAEARTLYDLSREQA